MSVDQKLNIAEQICWGKYLSREKCLYCYGTNFLCEDYMRYIFVDSETFFDSQNKTTIPEHQNLCEKLTESSVMFAKDKKF